MSSKFLTVRSSLPYELVCGVMERAITVQGYSISSRHNLTETLHKKGIQKFDHYVTIYEICNPVIAAEVLNFNLEFSTLIPCRISVYSDPTDQDSSTILQSAMPSLMLAAFMDETLPGMSRESDTKCSNILDLAKMVDHDIMEIMKRAAIGEPQDEIHQ